MPYAEIMEVIEDPVEICDPQHQNEDHDAVQDRFNLTLHGDKSVYNPQQKPCRNKSDKHGGKWHFMFSIHFPDSMPPWHRREVT